MAIAIDKEMREHAKKNGKYLFQVMLDSKYLSDEARKKLKGRAPILFRYEQSGPLPHRCAVELWRLLTKWKKADLV